MGEAFVGLNLTVETKLQAVDLRLGGIEKNQRLLRCRAKKIEKRLTSIESKVSEKPNRGEDMDFGQWDDDAEQEAGKHDEECEKEKEDAEQEVGKHDEECEKEKEDAEQEAGKHDEDGEKEKENSDNAQQEAKESDEESGSETEEMLKLEQLKEKSRVQADAFWKQIAEEEEKEKSGDDEKEEESKNSDKEKEKSGDDEKSGDEEKVEESEAEKDEEKVGGNEAWVEAEIIVASVLSEINEPETPTTPPRRGNQSDGTPTPPPRGGKEVEINEASVESEKKEVREALRRPEILLRCKEKTEMYGKPRKGSGKKATPTAGPKKRGRSRTRAVDAAPTITGKRKSEPSHWVQTPFTAGKKPEKKPKTKA
ncbi:hypothetical protein Bca4012_065237 [Brassica carinata]